MWCVSAVIFCLPPYQSSMNSGSLGIIPSGPVETDTLHFLSFVFMKVSDIVCKRSSGLCFVLLMFSDVFMMM